MKHSEYYVLAEDANERLDKVVAKYEEITRSYVQNLLNDNAILCNGKPAKANMKVKENDFIELSYDDGIELETQPQDLNLDVRYEDSDVVVVNKPKGMIVHPTLGNQRDTLVNGLLYHCKDYSF